MSLVGISSIERARHRGRGCAFAALFALLLLSGNVGCFVETSHPMCEGDLVRISMAREVAIEKPSTRQWLRQAHEQLAPLLPQQNPKALLTEDLLDADGKPIDVLAHFGRSKDNLESIFNNWDGLAHTAQLSGTDSPRDPGPPNWPDFEEVWIPVTESLSLFGLLGLSCDEIGRPREADCVIILSGILGHNRTKRTRDLATALRASGTHALALELRGHGQTDRRHPDVFYTFGSMETDDLVAVSRWLQQQPHIRRTGLIGFCWGANQAMLCAWYDGRPPNHLSISPQLAGHLRETSSQEHFQAGVIAFSPVLRFEEIIESVWEYRLGLTYPVLATLQSTVETRLRFKEHDHHPDYDPSYYPGNLRKLIDYEYARSELNYPGSVEDGLLFLRFLPYKGLPDGDKLMSARCPVLIVQGANDPLAGAQDVADLIAKTPNPNVAAVVLSGGGHVGFAAYARAYYFSLIINFFDTTRGPGATRAAQLTAN